MSDVILFHYFSPLSDPPYVVPAPHSEQFGQSGGIPDFFFFSSFPAESLLNFFRL